MWLLAILFYGVGDTVTTLVGLSTGDAVEIGPIAGPAMEYFGAVGLLGVKAVIFTVFVGVWAILNTPGRLAVPVALTIVGIAVTVWNGAVIVLAV